jgi:acyl-coenzyme A synthetase/AMP-(fatty) acid ligase
VLKEKRVSPPPEFAADGARQDRDGYFWILGRADDVLNVAGHRLSTMEIESALGQHAKVAEAAVVGRPWQRRAAEDSTHQRRQTRWRELVAARNRE